jgi:replicative DNA helicase
MIERELLYKAFDDPNEFFSKIREDDFKAEDCRQVYRYLLDAWVSKGKLPSRDSINRKFPGVLQKTKVDLSILIEEMIERRLTEGLDSFSRSVEKIIKNGDYDSVFVLTEEFLSLFSSEDSDIPFGHLSLKKEKKVASTGWEALDKAVGGGVNSGEFWLLTGRPKVGKSFFLCRLAISFYYQNKKVLFLTRETSPDLLQRRMIALILKESPAQLRFADAKELKERFKRIKKSEGQIIFSGGYEGEGIAGLVMKYQKHRPDIVIIDGLYLFDRYGGSDWQELTRLSRSVKRFALRKGVPVIASFQLSREGEKVSSLSTIAYADALVQDADVILRLSSEREYTYLGKRILEILGAREGQTGARFLLEFNLDVGEIEVLKEIEEV